MENEIKKREKDLIEFIENKLPEAKKMVERANQEGEVAILLHQDAFAADYQDGEYLLLGMFIKYIGLSGKTITIIGKNRNTLKEN